MAIYSAVPPPPESPPPQGGSIASQPATSSAVDIEAWTILALQALSVSPAARGTGTPLAIPLDNHTTKEVRIAVATGARAMPPRPRSSRDSLRRREAIQKGNEGSRARRRWENDRLMHVPNVQPPLPTDWQVQPTHPVHEVPYHVAQFWDRGVRERVEARTAALQAARKKQQRKDGSATGLSLGEVPRDLRETAKRRPAVKGWVRVLEEPMRRFLIEQSDGGPAREVGADDDDEVVFSGRTAALRELKERDSWKMARREVGREAVELGMVFESFGDADTASFKRWLTHSISDYYGLESKSVSVGEPARRAVYVGIKKLSKRADPRLSGELPRPLWEVCC